MSWFDRIKSKDTGHKTQDTRTHVSCDMCHVSSDDEPVRPYRTNRHSPAHRHFLYTLLVLLGIFCIPIAVVHGVPVLFTQSDWSVEIPNSQATAPFTGWNEYSSRDVGVNAGFDIRLENTPYTMTQTSDHGLNDTCIATGCTTGGGFNSGVFTNTVVSRTGPKAHIRLSTTPTFTDWSQRFQSNYGAAGPSHDIALSGNYAYMADDTTGITVVNISNPAAPTLETTYNTLGTALGVTVIGTTLYVADGGSGLLILDISTPASPAFVGSIDTIGNAYAVDVSGNFAYVADGVSGLQIINISVPAIPVFVETQDTPDLAVDVFYQNNHVYVADRTSGLQIINVQVPASPSIVGSVDTAGEAWGVTVAANFAYVADQSNGLQIINVTTPSSPSAQGGYDTEGNAFGIAYVGSTAYIADGDSGLIILDVISSTFQSLIGVYNTSGSAKAIAISGNYAYIADDVSGLQVIDISTPSSSPQKIGGSNMTGGAQNIVVAGDYVYALDATDDLRIVDKRTESSLIAIGSPYDITGTTHDITYSKQYVFVANDSAGLRIIDVSTASSPGPEFVYDTTGLARGVDVVANLAYIADGASGLEIINILSPLSPTSVSTSTDATDAFDVVVKGGFAYVADGTSGLRIIDVSTPASPGPTVTFATTGSAKKIAVSENYAYVTDDGFGFHIVDVTDPTSPVAAGTYDTVQSVTGIWVVENYAYISMGTRFLHIINISDPMSPQLAAVFDSNSPANVQGIDVAGVYAYVIDDNFGLRTVRISDHVSSGTYESPVIDLGGIQNFSAFRWSPLNLLAAISMTVDVQMSVDNIIWNGWTIDVSPDSDLGLTFDGNRYLRYRANLDSSTNPAISPRLDQFSVDFSNFPVGAELISSVFDTGDQGNYLQTISWTETLNNGDIRLQIATSGNNVNWNYCGSDACSTSGWLSWSNANNYYDSGNLAHALSSDAVDDRYFQYNVWLISDGIDTPQVDDIITTYDSAGLHVLAPNGISTSYAATAGTPFDIVLKAKDSDGSGDVTDHGFAAPIAVRLTASVTQPDGNECTSSFANNGNTQFTLPVLLMNNGVVTIPNVMLCDATVASNFTISAQEIFNGALSTTSPLTISSVGLAATTQLVFTTQPPTSALATVNFIPTPVVSIQDQFGNTIISNTTSVTLEAWGDSLCNTISVGGTLSVTSLGTTNGVAAFSNMSFDSPSAIFIKASGGSFADICSNVVDVIGTGYVVQLDPIYDVAADALVVTASLLRNGTLITDNSNMSLFDFDVQDDVGASLLAPGGYSADPEVSVVEDTVNSIYHMTWAPGGFVPDTAYQVFATITYNGSQYQGNVQAIINQLGVILADLQALDTQLDGVQTTVSGIETAAILVDTSVLALNTKISAHAASQAAYRAQTTLSLAAIINNIGSILEDTSKTVPDLVKSSIAKELAKGNQTEIVTTQAKVKTGATIPFRYRTASGLAPKVTVLDPKERGKIQSVPMKEVSGTGIYVYNITFKTNWGLGNFMIRVDEASKGSVDHIILTVIEDTTSTTASSARSSGVTLDTLYSRINSIDSNMDKLSSGVNIVKSNTENVSADIDALLDEVSDDEDSTGGTSGSLEKFGKYISSVSSIIGSSSSTTDLETILGKLNGIETTLDDMGSDASAAMDFNESARDKAERIKKFVTLIMAEIREDGKVEDAEEKAEILDDYLTDLKVTVEEIPSSVTTGFIAESVEETLEELNNVTVNKAGLEGIVVLVEQDYEAVGDIQVAEDLSPVDLQKMRNDVSGLKSLMVEIRELLDTEVNQPVVHGWLEGE